MATAIGLSMQLSASTSGLTSGLTEAERLINKLGRGAESAAKYFDNFRDATTGELPSALQEIVDRAGQLTSEFRAGQSDSESFAAGMAEVASEASTLSKAFQQAAQITASVITPQEKYDQQIQELQGHLEGGRISQETFNRAVNQAQQSLERASGSVTKAGAATEGTTLQFNELSGLFSILPGSIGSAAARLSGFASAGQGLAKLFAGGLTGAITGLVGSVTALINPFTLATAAIAAFGAATAAIGRGLIQLEDRVEQLGNQADKLGTSFKFIQVLETAAERSGNSIGGLSASFNRFLRAVDDANSGSDKAVKAFERIGISSADLASKKPEEIYKAMAIGITQIEDPAARAGIAIDLLGRSGLDLIPTFKQITNSERDLERYFAVLSEVDKIRLDNFGNSVDALNTATRGLGQSLLLPFVGLGDGVSKGAAEFTAGITAVVKPLGQILEPAFTGIGKFIELFLTGIGQIGRVIGSALSVIADALESLRNTIQEITGGVIGRFVAFAGEWLGIASRVEEPIQPQIQVDTEGPIASISRFYSEITKATEAAADLGQEGFDAALKYQEALQELAEQAAEGELNEEQLKRAVAQTTAEFEKSIAPLKAAQQERDRLAKAAEDAAKRQIEADRKAADQALEVQRIEREFGGNEKRAKAADQLLAINREIERVQAEQAAAAEASDRAAENAAAARLAALDQAKAAVAETAEFGFNQSDVDKAINQVREEVEKSLKESDIDLAPEAADEFFDKIEDLAKQLDLKIIDPKQFEDATKEAQKTFQEAAKQAKKVRDLQVKYEKEAAEIQERRIEELGKASQQALQVDDVRTSAGASEFLRLATGREDPAIAEYQKQLKKLEEIKAEIAKASQQPVEMI